MPHVDIRVATEKALDAVQPKRKAKNRPGESLHSPRRLAAVEQQLTALRYRKMGLTYGEIAERLGMRSSQTAWSAVESALKRTLQEPADDVRNLELGRLDAMFLPVYINACRGDLAAVNAALNIMTRRARLLGLDAPIKTENRTDLKPNSATGIMVVGGVMTPEAWAAAAKVQQEEITRGD
ncbi:hypothetical protein BKP43_21710 [Variovorax boronicumulans]|uniref:hypothetical protein n=1 Tax=Variovorax boronicumulans TaxID=436515 RepID=UPI000BB3A228|nr:hypothetical protein [Variovorax boronicumulans]PBI92233.1 hypothetical protein BKP43_21710 [Variovorax boronicumulans]